MTQIIWPNPALSDLDEIAEYIALDIVGAAKKLIKTAFDAIDRLEDHPESGRHPQELRVISIEK